MGPVVVVFQNCDLLSPRFSPENGDVETMLWEVPIGTAKVGVVGFDGCRFERCEFAAVGLAGTADTDPNPAIAVVENTVGNNLKCTGLAPAVSGGFIPGEVNHVGNKALGQCADLV